MDLPAVVICAQTQVCELSCGMKIMSKAGSVTTKQLLMGRWWCLPEFYSKLCPGRRQSAGRPGCGPRVLVIGVSECYWIGSGDGFRP